MSLNNTYQHSVDMSSFEALFGVKMKHHNDVQITDIQISLLEQERSFNKEHDNLRKLAKQNILKV